MLVTSEQVDRWLEESEGENLEFKEAKSQFDSTKLVNYCAALANEGGGRLVLGVTDKKPRRVVGSLAFQNTEQKKFELLGKLRLRVDVDECHHPDGRVVIFTVPSRPIGVPIQVGGVYWMRSGESLVPMSEDKLRSIFDETGPDFSAEVCPGATISHLSPTAVEAFRHAWLQKTGKEGLALMSQEQLLEDAELIVDGGVTFAALLLLGEHRALGRFLADAEIVFEWRLRNGSTQYDKRREFREGFFSYFNELWREIDLRNQVHQYQNGLFRTDIPTFREKPIREAILNAVAHRDYRTAGSIFIRQSPTMLEISSPGGFPEGITAENIVWKQKPRNRRVADNLSRAGLVERSGQGADLMFEWAVRDAKSLPDYSQSDPHEVVVRLDGQVRDEQFVKYLEQICAEQGVLFGVDELIVLSSVRDGEAVKGRLYSVVQRLVDTGAVERAGRGKLVLSRRYYAMVGRKGEYTRKRGLDRETHKALLLKHIEDNIAEGSKLADLKQVLPHLSAGQVKRLLQEMKSANVVHVKGKTKAACWFPGPEDD